AALAAPGPRDVKTRTKDKYRVVYTDHQRLELEKEFHYSRYITIRRKAELASSLGLSERQVKIWFQNRRAKERKINKKKLQQAQPGAAEPLSPAPGIWRGTFNPTRPESAASRRAEGLCGVRCVLMLCVPSCVVLMAPSSFMAPSNSVGAARP
uniref:Homeobox domain-containing protein n=1 Tax=Meleagris gallopavo TaxID=9103 RepID=A0A803YL13_MELGA